jgi:beta-glucosidase
MNEATRAARGGAVSRRTFIGGLAGAAATAGLTRGAVRPPRASAAGGANDPRIDALLAQMTLQDKIGQLNTPLFLPKAFLKGSSSPVGTDADRLHFVKGTWRDFIGPGGGFFGLVNETLYGLVPVARPRAPRQQAEMYNSLQEAAKTTRLGIPLLQISEGTHGSIGPGSTIFPEGPALAAMFDPDLIEAVYAATAREARAVGIHALNTVWAELVRDPRFGRGCQGFSEDPYLTATIVARLVRGMQGTDVSAPDRAIASLCHYPLETPSVGGLEGAPVTMGPRELRATHLEPWRVGFAEAGALMTEACATTIDGVPTHASTELLTDVLRDELGFRGVVLSEGDGFQSLVEEHVAIDQKQAGVLGMHAGIDVAISWEEAYLEGLVAAVGDGSVPMELVDRAVRRVLALKLALGLFEQPLVDPERAERIVHSPEHRQLALRTAREAVVLLKNDGDLLPLDRSVRRIAVIGPNADEPENLLGDYKAYPPLHEVPSVLDGIRSRVLRGTTVTHARGCGVLGDDRRGVARAVRAARRADVAVVVVGEQTKGGFMGPGTTDGEGRDIASLDLTGVQEELIQAIHATGTPTIVVLLTGRALSIRWTAEHVPAILVGWFPGERGGEAIADILFGRHNPSGRLPMTVPRHVGQLPMYYNQTRSRANASAYVDLPASPLFEFGFGLSYTEFAYHNVQLSKRTIARDESVDVSVDITNSGRRAGAEVVQLYVADNEASVAVPATRLRGYQKVYLRPGQTKKVRFTLGPRDLELVDRSLKTVVEPGTFGVMVGSSSRRIHLRGSFDVVG